MSFLWLHHAENRMCRKKLVRFTDSYYKGGVAAIVLNEDAEQ